MGESETTSVARSISAPEGSCSGKISVPEQGRFFSELAEFLWPDKAALHLAARTGASERMCRYWLAGSHKPTGRAMRAIFAEIVQRLD